MRKIILCFVFFFMAVESAHSGIKSTNHSYINKVYAYDDFGSPENGTNADVTIWMDTGIAECPQGVWLSPNAPGYNTMVSFVLSVYMANKSVRFQVYSDRIWAGSSSSKLCQVDAIRLE